MKKIYTLIPVLFFAVLVKAQPFTQLWKKVPGSAGFTTWAANDNSQNSIDFNATTNHLLVAKRGSHIKVVDPTNGDSLSALVLPSTLDTYRFAKVRVTSDGVIYAISMVGETNRAPFDLAEAEGELVGGFHTEYSSLKFALFFLSEYVNILAVSALATTLFLGGYRALPGLGFTEQWLGGWFTLVWFFVKVLAFFFVFVWLRGTLPRLRYDQFMKFGWKVLIPFSLVWIMIVSTLRVLSQRESSNFLVVAFIFSVALIYIAVTTLIDRAKVKTAIESKITNYSEPDFPVPEIPNSRAEQLNG